MNFVHSLFLLRIVLLFFFSFFFSFTRSTAFGLQTGIARIGAILGNVIFGQLVDANCAIPMLLVAGLLAFGGLSSLALPNTTGADIH